MPRVFLGIGSNIDPERNVPAALRLLARHATIVAISMFHRTEPIGRPEQPPYYNGVVEIATELAPHELKTAVLALIEEQLGRRRSADKYTARTIDIDILIHGDAVVSDGTLRIPDPDIRTRPFVALPLAELAPGLVLPGTGDAIETIAAGMSAGSMIPLADFTTRLRTASLPPG